MRLLILLSLLGFVSSYNIEDDYKLEFTGIQSNNPNQYENGRYINNILFTNDSLFEAENKCSSLDSCNGIFCYTKNNIYSCNGLDKVGKGVPTNLNSTSYRRIQYHRYNTNNHSIQGYTFDDSNYQNEYYLDLNHNGKYDNGEPKTKAVNDSFTFDNLAPGNYIVKQILHDNCYQWFPSLDGTGIGTDKIKGDGYGDVVLEYHSSNEGPHLKPYGGIVNSGRTNVPVTFDYVLGSDETTFISLPKDSYIVIGFTDETIINTDGTDIIIHEIGGGGEKANVYVSNNFINYTFLGKAYNNRKNNFDLSNINYNEPVHAIKIKTIDSGHGGWTGFDLTSVKVEHSSIGTSPFSYTVNVPNSEEIYFFNNCDYLDSCVNHCAVTTIFDDYDYESCKIGCDLFDLNNISFDVCHDKCRVDSDVNITQCNNGYFYNLKKYVYPTYDVLFNMTIDDKYLIDDCSTSSCFLDKLSYCTYNESCKSLSIQNDHVALFSDVNHSYTGDNSIFLTKSKYSKSRRCKTTSTGTTGTSTTPTSTTSKSTTTETSITPTSTTKTNTTQTGTTPTGTSTTSTTSTETTSTATTSTETGTSTT